MPSHDFTTREPQQFGMISFSDLTREEARVQSSTFGAYGICVSAQWAENRLAQPVLYIDAKGPVATALRTIFELGYRECKARIRFPDDAGWTMAYENKTVASAVIGATLWANLLQLYEYMEPSTSSREREWRIVNPQPDYGLAGKRLNELIKDASPPQGWAQYINVVKVSPQDVEFIVCPSNEEDAVRTAVPPAYASVALLLSN